MVHSINQSSTAPHLTSAVVILGCNLFYFCKAIEDEGGDPENIQIQLPADTSSRKFGKAKGSFDMINETDSEETCHSHFLLNCPV